MEEGDEGQKGEDEWEERDAEVDDLEVRQRPL